MDGGCEVIVQYRSTGDLLTYVTHLWQKAIELRGETRTIALDISKAFDKVWHENLLNKLKAMGLSPKLCTWFESYLKDRSIYVALDGQNSNSYQINAGVPQGAILSPTLFLIYINDLIDKTVNPLYCFADDGNVVSSLIPPTGLSAREFHHLRLTQISQINNDLEIIEDWGNKNLVQFNAQKTQAALFSKKNSSGEPNIMLSGSAVTLQSQLNILGVTAETNMSWHNHVADIAKRASQKLGVLFRTRHLYTPSQLLTLYKAQIRPTMEYCSHIWSAAPKHTLMLLNTVQKRAIKLINDPALTRNLDGLEHRRSVGDLSLFYRYYHGKCSEELARMIPPRVAPTRRTRQTDGNHEFTVKLEAPRTSLYQNSYLWRTASLWNKLPATVFPAGYNLNRFKTNIHRHFRALAASRA